MDSIDYTAFLGQGPDLCSMNRQELEEYLETVRGWIDRLDEEEPEDMESEAYEA